MSVLAIACLQRHEQRFRVVKKWPAKLLRRRRLLIHLTGNVNQVSMSIFWLSREFVHSESLTMFSCTEKTEHKNTGLLMCKENASHYENRTDWTWLACPMPNDEHSSFLSIDTSIALWYVFVDPYEGLNTGCTVYCQLYVDCQRWVS